MARIGRTAALFLTVLLVSSMVGAAYAMWDKTLYINGEVNTGEVSLEIISVGSDDPPGTIDPGKDKDVGWTTATIGADKQTITVTIHNAYPCYEVYVHFTVHNIGTIPVKLQSITVTAPPCLTVEGWNKLGEQIDPHPSANDRSDNTVYVHVEQGAGQGSTYTFTVKFYYVQWNEYVPPPKAPPP